MDEFEHQGVHLDTCSQCRGVWFDFDELSVLQHDGRKVDHAVLSQLPGQPYPIACPGCKDKLTTIEFPRGSGSHLETCSNCHGVWLDWSALRRLKGGNRRSLRRLRGRVDRHYHETFEREVESRQGGDPSMGVFTDWLLGIDPEIYSPTRRTPYMTWTLILVLVFVFFFQFTTGQQYLYDTYALTPNDLLAGKEWWTVFTSMFLHANALHLLGNLYFLWLAGDNVEDRLGPWKFLGLYLASGLAGTVFHLLLGGSPALPCLGASGAISGLLGAYALFFPRRKIAWRVYYFMWYNFLLRIPAWLYFGFWFALQFAMVAMEIPGVGFWAHIGGFVLGLGWAAKVKYWPTI